MNNVIKSEILAHTTSSIDDLLLELFDLLIDMNEYLRSFNFIDQSFDESDYDFRYWSIRKKEREIEALGYFGHREWNLQY